MGLVGLYACSVRRLEVRKRNAAYFLGFIGFLGLLQLLQLLSRFVLWLLLCTCCLCWLCLVVCVLVVVLFPFGRYDKRKGAPLLVLPLLVRVLWFPLLLFRLHS